MSRFPQYLRRQLAYLDEENVKRATRDTENDGKTYTNTPGGDARKLRGIPAIGRSVRGAVPGTVPGERLWR